MGQETWYGGLWYAQKVTRTTQYHPWWSYSEGKL